jgi:hypothetical protein
MRREDAEKLLGGHAAGTLTEAERRALMEAALHDQALFDALAGEEALRELLEDPQARRVLEAAVAPGEASQTGFAAWLRRPRSWTLAGALAATAVLVVVLVSTRGPERRPAPFELAKRAEPAAPELPLAAPAPAPRALPAPALPRGAVRDQAAAKPQNGPAFGTPGAAAGSGGGSYPPPTARLSTNDAAPAAAPPPPPPETVAKARADALSEAREEKERKGEAAAEGAAQPGRAQQAGRAAAPAAVAGLVAVAPPSLRYAVNAGRLTVDAGQSGYLYVLDASAVVYSGPIEPGKPAVIAAPAGAARVSLLFSRTPASDPRSLLSHRPATTESGVAGGRLVQAAAPATFVAADVELPR